MLDVVLMGSVNSVSGYGARSRDLFTEIIRRKGNEWNIKIVPTPWGSTPLNALKEDNPEHKEILKRLYFDSHLPKQPDLSVQVALPSEFMRIGKFSVGCSAMIESDQVHESWLEGANRIDLVLASSNHGKNVMLNTSYQKVDQKSGQQIGTLKIESAIDVLFEGINTEIYKKTDQIHSSVTEELNKIPESWCFLVVGHFLAGDWGQDRKDIFNTVKVFLEAFKNKQNPPALILKTSGATFSVIDRDDIVKKISMIRDSVQGVRIPNVYLLHGELYDDEMNSLYNHPKVKAMYSFTHGEGFGRPFAEFSVTNKPLIVPNWSGQLDFVNPEHSILLPGTLNPIHKSVEWKGILIKDSKWFTVNYQIAAQALRDVFDNYKIHLERSRGSNHYIKTNFSREKMEDKFFELLDKYKPAEKVKLKLPGEGNTIKLKMPKINV